MSHITKSSLIPEYLFLIHKHVTNQSQIKVGHHPQGNSTKRKVCGHDEPPLFKDIGHLTPYFVELVIERILLNCFHSYHPRACGQRWYIHVDLSAIHSD